MRLWLALTVTISVLVTSVPAFSHGIWGHVHVTGWAAENLPEGELKAFFEEPEVLNALLFGAAFTDSGYWPQGGELAQKSRVYSEHTHWEPFIESFILWVIANDPPPWDTLQSRQRAAFLMGCASHGLQDEIFDSLFLYQIEEHDGAGQAEADPGTDGFLALDEHIRFMPTSSYLPYDTLLKLYEGLDEEVDAETIERSVALMENIYLNHDVGLDVARTLGMQFDEVIPWARAHYLDVDIPGSLVSEIEPTALYMQAIWDRLHGRGAGATPVVFAYPAVPRRLHGHRSDSPDSWVTFVMAAGVQVQSAQTGWVDNGGAGIVFDTKGTRWGTDWPRLLRMMPAGDLDPGGWYTVNLQAGVTLIDGSQAEGFEHRFQVACTQDEGACEDLGDIPGPSIGTEPEPDAGQDAPDSDPPEPDPDAGQTPPTPSGGDGGCSSAGPGAVISWRILRR